MEASLQLTAALHNLVPLMPMGLFTDWSLEGWLRVGEFVESDSPSNPCQQAAKIVQRLLG